MKPQPTAPPVPASSTELAGLKVVSDGNPFNTTVTVNGEPLTNVIGLRWEIDTGSTSRMVVELDWVDVEYHGDYVKCFTRPTLREALGMWWRGKKRAE